MLIINSAMLQKILLWLNIQDNIWVTNFQNYDNYIDLFRNTNVETAT